MGKKPVSVYVTEEQMEFIMDKARQAGLSTSGYVRSLLKRDGMPADEKPVVVRKVKFPRPKGSPKACPGCGVEAAPGKFVAFEDGRTHCVECGWNKRWKEQ